jgi:histidinol-phosphate aminotransferase
LLNDENIKIIFICSPNNPTGNSFDRETILEIIEKFRGIVVIDEAYIDFSSNASFISLINRYENLIVMQTFSKAWGAAGVRVGMAFADSTIIRYLYRVKPPYNISEPNQREVLKRLGNREKYRRQILTIKSERIRVEKLITELEAVLNVYPSDSNFLLVKVKDADLIYNKLIEKSIIVRNRSPVVNNCLRITIGTKKENDKLVTELRRISL